MIGLLIFLIILLVISSIIITIGITHDDANPIGLGLISGIISIILLIVCIGDMTPKSNQPKYVDVPEEWQAINYYTETPDTVTIFRMNDSLFISFINKK